jgi:hypothetical protein
MTTNVTPLRKSDPKQSRAPKATRTLTAAQKRRLFRQRVAAGMIGIVGLVLTGLSLDHLAEGVQVLTQSGPWHSLAMAIGIDAGFISLELGQLVITETLRKELACYTNPTIKGTLAASALMNAYGFGSHASDTVDLVAACALGFAVPALIYVLTRVSAKMWMDAQRS